MLAVFKGIEEFEVVFLSEIVVVQVIPTSGIPEIGRVEEYENVGARCFQQLVIVARR